MLDACHSEPFAALKGKLREESIRNVIARPTGHGNLKTLSLTPDNLSSEFTIILIS
jgi:hypothetical protein